MALKFSFSKSKPKPFIDGTKTTPAIREDIQTSEESRIEVLDALDGSFGRKRKAEPLVIPLIKRNFHQSGDCQDKEAAAELLEEVKKLNERWENRNSEEEEQSNLIVDMLANRAENGATDDGLNVEARPESSSLDDYDKIPVHGYGMAMLRGMGFKKEEGIGKTFKQTIKPLDVNLRPKGLGLGATPMGGGKNGATKQIDDDEEVSVEPKVGDSVHVLRGPHKGTTGRMVGYDGDTSRILVECSKSQSIVSVPITSAAAVSEITAKQNREPNAKEKTRDQRSTSEESDAKSSSKGPSNVSYKLPEEPWLLPDIRVRVIDKKVNRGRHYKEKVRVVDVITPFTCDCRTDSGLLLENLHQSSLETVVPKVSSGSAGFVKIVRGEKKGLTAEVLSMKKDKCRIDVFVIDMEEEPMRLSFDDVSELATDD